MVSSNPHHHPPAAAQIWQFDAFELGDAIGLRRGGVALSVEPKALDVLIYLVRHHERIVSRDELLGAVWADDVVEEAVLSQIIFKLRKCLGDQARNPRFIATLHRRGYQFVGPLGAPDALPLTPAPTRRWAVVAVCAVVALALALPVGLLIKRGSSVPEPLPRLGFIPIQMDVVDPGAMLLGQMFDDLLFNRLGDLPGLITRSRSFGSMQLDPVPAKVGEYARQQQVEWVLRGRISPGLDERRVWLDMELIRIGSDSNQNFPLDRFDLPLPGAGADISKLLGARNRVAADISRYIGITLRRSIQSDGDPDSLDSLRLFLLGLKELSRLSCGGQLAVQYLGEAVAMDPQFTDAWVWLGYAYFNEVWACGGDVRYLEKAHEMVQQALLLEPGNLQALPLEVQLLASLGRADEALLKLLPELRENPNSAILNFYASLLFNYAGNLDRSEDHLNTALRLDPFLLGTDVSDPPMLFLYQGNWQRFLDQQTAIDSSYHRFYRGYALWQIGDLDQATAVLKPFEEADWQKDPFAAFGQALIGILESRPDEAIERVRFTHQRRHQNGIRDGEMTFKEAWLMALAGQSDLALEYLTASVDEGFACNVCIRNSPFGALLIDSPSFRALTEQIAEREQALTRQVQADTLLTAP